MGLFMDLAAVLAPEADVMAYLKRAETAGAATCHAGTADRSLAIYSEPTGDLERVRDLSRALGVPAFGLHVHDDDLWMYEFFVAGDTKDRFITIPEYWGEQPEVELASWKGDAEVIARFWPGVGPSTIDRYLVRQDGEAFDSGDLKAYPDDEYPYGDFWQIVDFLKKLGTPYPED